MSALDSEPIVQEISLTPMRSMGELIVADEGVAPAPKRSFHARFGLFMWLFVAPVAIASIYLFFIASDRYVSEVQFVVRSANANSRSASSAASESSAASAASASMIQGMSRASDNAYIVNQYILSRDALDWLMRHENMTAVFGRPEADFLNRFPNFYTRNTRENFYQYYSDMVDAEVDGSTGINSITVQAFTPEDAEKVATGLLHSAEALVNRLNERHLNDALRLARAEVEDARKRVADVEARLAKYRDRAGLIDPSGETNAAFQTITLLSTELAQTEASIDQLKALTPNNPSIGTLMNRARSYRAEIERRKLALVGREGSIADKMARYDELILSQSIASKALTTAEIGLQMARHNAEQQQLYLETVAKPNLPDQYKYPRRAMDFALTVLVAGIAFVTVRALRQFAVEHAV